MLKAVRCYANSNTVILFMTWGEKDNFTLQLQTINKPLNSLNRCDLSLVATVKAVLQKPVPKP